MLLHLFLLLLQKLLMLHLLLLHVLHLLLLVQLLLVLLRVHRLCDGTGKRAAAKGSVVIPLHKIIVETALVCQRQFKFRGNVLVVIETVLKL